MEKDRFQSIQSRESIAVQNAWSSGCESVILRLLAAALLPRNLLEKKAFSSLLNLLKKTGGGAQQPEF